MAFQKGQSGNLNGRPTDRPWAQAIARATAKRKHEVLDALAESIVAKALTGDVSALKEIGDRLDGKPAQIQVVKGDSENPVHFVVRAPDVAGSVSDWVDKFKG